MGSSAAAVGARFERAPFRVRARRVPRWNGRGGAESAAKGRMAGASAGARTRRCAATRSTKSRPMLRGASSRQQFPPSVRTGFDVRCSEACRAPPSRARRPSPGAGAGSAPPRRRCSNDRSRSRRPRLAGAPVRSAATKGMLAAAAPGGGCSAAAPDHFEEAQSRSTCLAPSSQTSDLRLPQQPRPGLRRRARVIAESRSRGPPVPRPSRAAARPMAAAQPRARTWRRPPPSPRS